MEKTILIRKDKPAFQVLIISFFVNLIGIFLIASSDWNWLQLLIGAFLLFIGLTVLALKTETLYDCESNSLTVKWKSLIFSKSQNETLPEIDYVAIVRVKTSRNRHYKSITLHESGFKCNLNLIFKNSNERFRKLCTVDKEEALRIAKEIATGLNKPILDNSTAEKKWIK